MCVAWAPDEESELVARWNDPSRCDTPYTTLRSVLMQAGKSLYPAWDLYLPSALLPGCMNISLVPAWVEMPVKIPDA